MEQLTPEKPVEWDRVRKDELAELGRDEQSPLAGLAFSGGGIRSATFNLGILEYLHSRGILSQVDFLSTVSGGGYIGAWLAANIKRNPNWLKPATNWRESIRHLRRYSNYLSPQLGFFSADTWTMATVWIRNAMLIQITVFLAIAVTLMLPRLTRFAFTAWPHLGAWRGISFILLLLAVSGIAANLLRLQREKARILKANAWKKFAAAAAAAAALAAVTGSQFAWFTVDPVPPLWAIACALLLVAMGFLLVPSAVELSGEVELNYGQGWTQWLVVVPMMLTAFFVASVMWNYSFESDLSILSYTGLLREAWQYWTFPLAFIFSCLLLLGVVSIQASQPGQKRRHWGAAVLAPAGAMAALYALLCGLQLCFNIWVRSPVAALAGTFHALVWGPSMVLFAFSLAIVLLMGLLGRASPEDRREWWSRLGAWLCIYGVGWLLICVPAIYAPLWLGNLVDLGHSLTVTAGTGWLLTTAGGLLAGKSAKTSGEERQDKWTTPLEILARTAPFLFIAGVLLMISTALHTLLLNTRDAGAAPHGYWQDWTSIPLHSTAILLAALSACLLIFAWRVDINEFSLNAFYRNRLVRCYLGATRVSDPPPDPPRRPQNFTGFDLADDLPLAAFRRRNGYQGPLPIVNCAVNLGSSSDLELHTRRSANFILTPLHCGSHRAKMLYYPTIDNDEPYAGGGNPTLGQAISVSGAAASPNMGFHTSPVVAFLLTVFNVRLGWWFPKPKGASPTSAAPNFSLRYLVKELFGSAGEDSDFLMVSDGGHFENLAVYELVRRECAVIVCGNGECDAALHFESLGSLIRMCETDFCATIDIDVSAIKPDLNRSPYSQSPYSRSHCAVGTIRYASGKHGTLIYLESSLTGDEPTPVLQYKSTHAAFPHESTGDQFFAEDQFESYRQLGFHVAESALRDIGADENLSAPAVAARLHSLWTPALANTSAFTSHTARLSALWSRLAGDPELAFLDAELFPDLAKSVALTPTNADAQRRAFYLSSELLQLMEDVYIDLRLHETFDHPDNEGWKHLFLQWSTSPSVQDGWEKTIATYGKRFQYFAQSRLRLKGSRAESA